MSQKNHLITVVGPTAIGKTALAIALAKHFGCEIISCDSRQFYKEMTIGTAVPSEDELQTIPHHFIQNKSIFESFTVGDFERETLDLLDELFKKNPIQIMVGGSGLYIDAITKGMDVFPDVSEEIKQKVEDLYDEKGINILQELLKEKDQKFYHSISEKNPQTLVNPQRMKRYVSVCLASNLPYSHFLNKNETSRNFTPIFIGLNTDREELYQRINKRVDLMMQNGLLEEVRQLLPHRNINTLQAVGYRELFDYLDGNFSLETAIEEVKKNTRRFAKRQFTWFKRNTDIQWFDYKTQAQYIIQHIEKAIKNQKK